MSKVDIFSMFYAITLPVLAENDLTLYIDGCIMVVGSKLIRSVIGP